MQNLFTKFFERKRSNDNAIQIYTKKRRKQNITLDTSGHGPNLSKGSYSPSLKRPSSNYSRGGNLHPISGLASITSSKINSNRIEKIQATKNFLQPLSPNHLKVRASPGSLDKNVIQRFYKFHDSRASPKGSPPPRERSSDYISKLAQSKRLAMSPSHEQLKVVKKSPGRDRKPAIDDKSPKRRSDLEKFLLERKRINKEFITNAKKNCPEVCLKLLSQESGRLSADINHKDKDGWTALHHAAYNQNVKFVNILLYNDAKVDIQDVNGVTPLILAVAKGNSPITQVAKFLTLDSSKCKS